MRLLGIVLAALLIASPVWAQTRIGSVDTTLNLTSPNDSVTIERFDDPGVKNVSCYISRAVKGGWSSVVGLAEDPSNMSVACRATGKVEIISVSKSKNGEVIFSDKASALFKTIRVSRFYDVEKNMLVYLVWSTKLIDGSPANSVTAVSIN